jgi:hypothetical protein
MSIPDFPNAFRLDIELAPGVVDRFPDVAFPAVPHPLMDKPHDLGLALPVMVRTSPFGAGGDLLEGTH